MSIRPESPLTILADRRQRRIEYLRLSVTDRCDLACDYCMPKGAYHPGGACDLLPFRDALIMVERMARLGVRKVRVTGGEPLIRKGILGFIRTLHRTPGIERVALTTNGTLLSRFAAPLSDAGVGSVNVSLDTLRPERFAAIAGADRFAVVREGIDAALAAGFDRVKVNVVVMRGVNDDEIADFCRWTLHTPLEVRFIEYMPATPGIWRDERFVPAERIEAAAREVGELIPADRERWGGPARLFTYEGAAGKVGFISAVSRHFCDDCNRLRLTSRGELMTCLFGTDRLDLKPLIRRPETDFADAVRAALDGRADVRTMPVIEGGSALHHVMTSIGG